MPFIHTDSTAFDQKLRAANSTGALGAVDLLKAAFWVLSYPMPAQALLLFQQALEVACKGLLQEIHVLLVADKLDYAQAKIIVRERLASHRLGQFAKIDADIDAIDPARSCSFEEAWKRVREMISLRGFRDASLHKLAALRNEIVHRGGGSNRDFQYSEAILTIALPAVEEFYAQAYGGLLLQDLTGPELMREIRIAQEYVKKINDDPSLPTGLLLHTFKCRYQQPLIIGAGHLLYDANGERLEIGWKRFETNNDYYSQLQHQHKTRGELVGQRLNLFCKICHEIGIVIGIEDECYMLNGQKAVDPCSLFCPSCGLDLSRDYRVLAKLHYGPLTEGEIGPKEWKKEIGL